MKLRQVLALAAVAVLLCGAAAQSAPPGAPPAPPESSQAASSQPAPDSEAEQAPPAEPSAPPEAMEAAAAEPAGASAEEPLEVPREEKPVVLLRTILGLHILVVLAYLGGHPLVLRLERRLGISQVITAGFPFLVLGAVASLPAVSVLNETMLAELTPALRIGLAWIGLTVGLRFNAGALQGMPIGIGRVVLLTTILPFAFLVCCCGVSLASIEGIPLAELRDPERLRDALILGIAGTITSLTVATRGPRVLRGVAQLEEFVGIAGLAFIAAYLRPRGPDVTWQLPGAAWLLLTVGLGTTIGFLVHVFLRGTRGRADFLALSIGSVSFIAGAAGYLYVPSLAVAFVAGVILTNYGADYRERLLELMERLERPIYLMSLVVVGALWEFADWRGWLLMPVFVSMRLLGKSAALRLASSAGPGVLSPEDRGALAASPIGALAIAIVVSSQLLYPDSSISVIVTAVIGSSVVTEIIVQIGARARSRREPAPQEAKAGEAAGPGAA